MKFHNQARMKTTEIKPTIRHARKILNLVSRGLVCGLGVQEPGKMCVEAAVCAAFGLPHSDKPSCVGPAVRDFKIKLNDCAWPSDMHRANGMRQLAIAQLGSNEIDQMAFGKLMYLRGVQKLLPFVWRKEAEQMKPDRQKEMLEHCEKMEAVTTFEEAEKVAKSAYASASAYRHELLKLTAQIGVEVLKEMKSPGCKWLYLCEEAK